jgi:hypothetical protein
MPDFLSELANFIGPGDSWTVNQDGSRCRDRIEISIPGHAILIRQNQDVITYDLKELSGQFVPSSTVSISNVLSFAEGEEIAKDIASLLSFAQHSRVVPFAFSMAGKARRIFGKGGFVGAWRPPFAIGDGKNVTRFIEGGWGEYQKYKHSRALFALFGLLAYADFPDTPLEIELSQMVICLENLKAYWALSDGQAKGITERTDGFYLGGKKQSLEALIRMMLNEVGMALPADWAKIVALRNAIIHRGLIRPQDKIASTIFGSTLTEQDMYSAMLRIEYAIHDMIRQYLLRLLSYKGHYHPYSVPGGRATI